ncbi:hypothetical protein HHL11_12720 [Ramlibacter sp. G-1-2-2]|uniref:Fenitrothion hydrolase n=1 Tax=Ramlibacter agri TaxID=2728837 RepID=A0A848H516_9BURK|nr:hypothetical protein [Ramlibacter agri]NML44621.1 hypothetical protein [Ramlibacter agri]
MTRSRFAFCLALACAAPAAGAHALQDRYDLPLPLSWVVAGAGAVVLLTFVLAAFFARGAADASALRRQRVLRLPQPLLLPLQALSLLLFTVTVAAALWGTQDPLMNLAPTMVWIVAWLGLIFAAAFFVDLWPALDPWRSLHAWLPWRNAGPLRWPRALGCWPAVALLLAWCWLEIVAPIASSPRRMGWLLLAWTVLSLAGMLAFGRRRWQAHADVFALVFATFGRMPPRRLELADPPSAESVAGLVGFVLALLSTVIFDGLHGAPAWLVFEETLRRFSPVTLDVNGHLAGTAGLLLVWLAFVVLFEAAARAASKLAGTGPDLRERLALTLLPIATGYVVAHNFSTFVLQGQRVFALLSDPFGRQWDLFGTASFYPDIAWLDARAIWFIAVTAIVAGHAASIWWSHRVTLAHGVAPRRAALALAPLTALMVGFTAVSLLLLAAGEA